MGSKEILCNIYGNLLNGEERDSIQYIKEPSRWGAKRFYSIYTGTFLMGSKEILFNIYRNLLDGV